MKERDEEKEKRRNVIVLTIIAIATMIVVLVGATFAYLASTVGSEDQANIEAATNAGNDMFLINAGGDMNILANTENFGNGSGNQVDNSEATVTLQTTSTSQVTYNYNVSVEVSANNFEYTSGTCYRKGTQVTGVNEVECTSNNNVWANVGGGYACYTGIFNPVDDEFSNNSIGCLTDVRNMWVAEEAAELVVDLYKVDETISSSSACSITGICVDKMHSVVSGVSTQGSCTNNNIWIASKYQNNLCYVPIATGDLTTENNELSLLSNVTINATNETVTDRYFVEVTLINYNHNQIVNGNKTFSGMLKIERITT